MFTIFVYVAIICIVIYFVFQGLVKLSSHLFLIDEYFQNKFQDINQNLTNKFLDASSKNDSNKYNPYLRFDFIVSIMAGTLWFIFPKLLFNFTPSELKNMPSDQRYLGQLLGLITIISAILPLRVIEKENSREKKMVLLTKLLCGLGILLVLLAFVFYMGRINSWSIISIILLSFWIVNDILGLYIKRT